MIEMIFGLYYLNNGFMIQFSVSIGLHKLYNCFTFNVWCNEYESTLIKHIFLILLISQFYLIALLKARS